MAAYLRKVFPFPICQQLEFWVAPSWLALIICGSGWDLPPAFSAMCQWKCVTLNMPHDVISWFAAVIQLKVELKAHFYAGRNENKPNTRQAGIQIIDSVLKF